MKNGDYAICVFFRRLKISNWFLVKAFAVGAPH